MRLEDVDDDPVDGQDGCTFLVGLMQKDGRRQRNLDRNLETVGFAIYEVDYLICHRQTRMLHLTLFMMIFSNILSVAFLQIPDQVCIYYIKYIM